MLTSPSFEKAVLVTDDTIIAAKISSLFRNKKQYFPVLDGPRMARTDADNEILRRRNSIEMIKPQQVLLAKLNPEATHAMQTGWGNCTVSDIYDEHLKSLYNIINKPLGKLSWGSSNLGVGLYKARLEKKELHIDLESSPQQNVIKRGSHLLVACEQGNELSEIAASNLAFACDASYTVFPELPETDRTGWIEHIYALGENGYQSVEFNSIVDKARSHSEPIEIAHYKTVLFITAGFPWGITLPQQLTTHMYRYPDFTRNIVEGIWSSQSSSISARTALLIDPNTVAGSEIPTIQKALEKNGTLTRLAQGPSATGVFLQFLLDLLPHDIVVFSSHAGDAPGKRITYQYNDTDGRQRNLTVDQATGMCHDPFNDKYIVTEYHRFHSLDGIDWRDNTGKAALPVGSALTTWDKMDVQARKNSITNEDPITRVIGSMAIRLYNDEIWLFASHGFGPGSVPIIFNNSCWSWHELSERVTFAGARAYIGTLFPITDIEAQELGQSLFSKHIGKELVQALWLAQRDVYGSSDRRPYVMVGLPFVSIRNNRVNSQVFLERAYIDAIAHWSSKARNSPHHEIRDDAKRILRFLIADLESYRNRNIIY